MIKIKDGLFHEFDWNMQIPQKTADWWSMRFMCCTLIATVIYTCQMSIRQTLQCHVLDCNAHTTNIVGVVWFDIFSSRRIGCIVLFFVSIVVIVWCFWCMRYRKLCKQFDFQSLNESKSLEHHRGHIEYGLFVYLCTKCVYDSHILFTLSFSIEIYLIAMTLSQKFQGSYRLNIANRNELMSFNWLKLGKRLNVWNTNTLACCCCYGFIAFW